MKIIIDGTPKEIADLTIELQGQPEGSKLPKEIPWYIDTAQVNAAFNQFMKDTAKAVHAEAEGFTEERPYFQSPTLGQDRRERHQETYRESTNQMNDSDE